jgi:hypothetical protein
VPKAGDVSGFKFKERVGNLTVFEFNFQFSIVLLKTIQV